ncbi:MAG: hypothetical protein V1847_01665 [Candidatus Diapherotrites archaeon]
MCKGEAILTSKKQLILPKRNNVFVSSISIPSAVNLTGGRKIDAKLIGFHHLNIIPFWGSKRIRVLNKILLKEQGVILAERADTFFLPKKFAKQAIALESEKDPISKFVHEKLNLRGYTRLLSYAVTDEALARIHEFFSKVNVIEGLPSRILVSEMAKEKFARKLMSSAKISPQQFINGTSLYITGRSLLMASQIMEYANETLRYQKKDEPLQPVTIVVGSGHMNEIHSFISNPELGRKYAKLLEREWSKVEGAEEICRRLRAAENVFEWSIVKTR